MEIQHPPTSLHRHTHARRDKHAQTHTHARSVKLTFSCRSKVGRFFSFVALFTCRVGYKKGKGVGFYPFFFFCAQEEQRLLLVVATLFVLRWLYNLQGWLSITPTQQAPRHKSRKRGSNRCWFFLKKVAEGFLNGEYDTKTHITNKVSSGLAHTTRKDWFDSSRACFLVSFCGKALFFGLGSQLTAVGTRRTYVLCFFLGRLFGCWLVRPVIDGS